MALRPELSGTASGVGGMAQMILAAADVGGRRAPHHLEPADARGNDDLLAGVRLCAFIVYRRGGSDEKK